MSIDNVNTKANKTNRKLKHVVTITSSNILEAREKIKKGREQLDSLERTLDQLEREKELATRN